MYNYSTGLGRRLVTNGWTRLTINRETPSQLQPTTPYHVEGLHPPHVVYFGDDDSSAGATGEAAAAGALALGFCSMMREGKNAVGATALTLTLEGAGAADTGSAVASSFFAAVSAD